MPSGSLDDGVAGGSAKCAALVNDDCDRLIGQALTRDDCSPISIDDHLGLGKNRELGAPDSLGESLGRRAELERDRKGSAGVSPLSLEQHQIDQIACRT